MQAGRLEPWPIDAAYTVQWVWHTREACPYHYPIIHCILIQVPSKRGDQRKWKEINLVTVRDSSGTDVADTSIDTLPHGCPAREREIDEMEQSRGKGLRRNNLWRQGGKALKRYWPASILEYLTTHPYAKLSGKKNWMGQIKIVLFEM